MKRMAAALLMTVCLTGAETGAELAARVRALRERSNFRAGGKLVRVEAHGERTAFQVSMKALAMAGGVRLWCEVTDPAAARVRVLIDPRGGGDAVIRVGHSGEAAARTLAFANWADALLGTDLSYEDLMESHFLWAGQALVKQEAYGARQCNVLKSTPGAGERSHYSSVTSWLDWEIHFPVKVEKVLRHSGVVKEFLYYGLRQANGVWSASQVEVRVKGRKRSTFLIITRGSGRANLTAKDFDPKLLIARAK